MKNICNVDVINNNSDSTQFIVDDGGKARRLATENFVKFPNYGDIIGTYTNTGFTAPQNCWAKFEITSGWTNATVSINSNGVLIQQIKNTDSYPIRTSIMIPLKKGDVITFSDKTAINGITAVLYSMR